MIRVLPPQSGSPYKLADVEIVCQEGDLAGLRVTGFAVWPGRGEGLQVTMPSRRVEGYDTPHHVPFVRGDGPAIKRLTEAIVAAYKASRAVAG